VDKPAEDKPAPSTRLTRAMKSPHAWVSSTYFAEGYPYTIVNNLAEMVFNRLGASLEAIGLTAIFHLPWNLKFLWAPFVDQYETKRRWLLGVEVVLSITLLGLAFWVGSMPVLSLISVLFVVLALASATHDIAIDGFYLEGLDEKQQSQFVGYRAMAFKVANALIRGPAVMLAGLVGWSLGLTAMAAVMAGLLCLHVWILPRVEQRRASLGAALMRGALRPRFAFALALIVALVVVERQLSILRPLWTRFSAWLSGVPIVGSISLGGWIAFGLLAALVVLLLLRGRLKRRLARSDSHFARAFLVFLEQPKVERILAFVVLFRTGESFLQKMRVPFLQNHMKMSDFEYGLANGTLGVVASIAATMLGGWLIARQGLRRWIWPFVLAQNVLNLLYVAGEGLGTAVFVVYLMRCCDPAHKAAHMAIVTALMSVSFTLAGMTSGYLARALGFANYFAFSFMASVPMMLLLFVVPYLDGRPSASTERPAD
jgi:PAT family beta-lactamase induction signal transducer AmpG